MKKAFWVLNLPRIGHLSRQHHTTPLLERLGLVASPISGESNRMRTFEKPNQLFWRLGFARTKDKKRISNPVVNQKRIQFNPASVMYASLWGIQKLLYKFRKWSESAVRNTRIVARRYTALVVASRYDLPTTPQTTLCSRISSLIHQTAACSKTIEEIKKNHFKKCIQHTGRSVSLRPSKETNPPLFYLNLFA